jgi:DNA polymerase III delta subunit
VIKTYDEAKALLQADKKANQTHQIYILHGDDKRPEYFLLRAFEDHLVRTISAITDSADGIEILSGDTLNYWDLTEAISTVAMGCDTKLVIVRDYPGLNGPKRKKNEEEDDTSDDDSDTPESGEENLQGRVMEFLKHIPESSVVIFSYRQLPFSPGKSKRVTDFLKMEGSLQSPVVVSFERQSEAKLTAWVTEQFKKNHHTISNYCAQRLVYLCSRDMFHIDSEITKLSLYAQSQMISEEDLAESVFPSVQSSIFDLSGAITSGNSKRALTTLQNLLSRGEEPFSILATLTTSFFRLYIARILIDNKERPWQIKELCGISSSYAVDMVVQEANNRSSEYYLNAMNLCYETECSMKTNLSAGQYDEAIEFLIMRLLVASKKKK